MSDLHMKHWPPGVPTEIEIPAQSLAQNLADTAARLPDKAALIYYGATITYAQLHDGVERVAGWLQQNGVQRGDRVILYMQNAPQWVMAYYAILRADACVVPVNPMNRAKEIEHLLADTGARIALIGSELKDEIMPLLLSGELSTLGVAAYADMAGDSPDDPLPEALAGLTDRGLGGPGVIPWSEILAAGARPAPSEAGPDDLAVIPYTSGTTGLPKGCVHTHRTVQSVIHAYKVWTPYRESDTLLSALPYFHVTGMQNAMNTPILCGATIVLMTRWDRDLAIRLLERHRVTIWRSITTMVIDVLNAPGIRDRDLSALWLIGAGGAAMPEAVAARLRDMLGLEVVEGYGMTETIAATHLNPPQAPRRQCLGIPTFGVDSRILDVATGAELGPDQDGEIVMTGPQLFLGYWFDQAASEAAFVTIDGKRFFRTGDIGHYDRDGYFYMTDRVKRMINAAGYKVWPAEVESLMLHHPGIAEACVIGLPDPRRGETVKAFVVPRDGHTPTESGVIAWCHGRMAAYKCPRVVEFVPALPRNASGKVQWRDLAATEAQRLKSPPLVGQGPG